MRRYFGKKKKPNHSLHKTPSDSHKPPRAVVSQPSKRERAEQLSKLFPKSPIFSDNLNEIVFESPITEVDKDALRLIRRVSLEKKSNGQLENRIDFSQVEELVPEEIKGEGHKESLFLFVLFLEELLDHFEAEDIAAQHKAKMKELLKEESSLSVKDLIEAIGGDKSRTALVVRCLNQAVAITGHTHIKCNVCGLPTKDLPGSKGWKINVVLAEYVQVTHTRREVNVDVFGGKDQWQLEFDVRLTFERNMAEMTNSSLVVTDLEIVQVEGEDFINYLKEKFGTGNLVIC